MFARWRGESLILDPQVTEVGAGKALEDRVVTIRVRNVRNMPIRIVGGTHTCACEATMDLPVTLGPDETRTIASRVRYPGGYGAFERSFVLYTNAERNWTVYGYCAGRVKKPPD